MLLNGTPHTSGIVYGEKRAERHNGQECGRRTTKIDEPVGWGDDVEHAPSWIRLVEIAVWLLSFRIPI